MLVNWRPCPHKSFWLILLLPSKTFELHKLSQLKFRRNTFEIIFSFLCINYLDIDNVKYVVYLVFIFPIKWSLSQAVRRQCQPHVSLVAPCSNRGDLGLWGHNIMSLFMSRAGGSKKDEAKYRKEVETCMNASLQKHLLETYGKYVSSHYHIYIFFSTSFIRLESSKPNNLLMNVERLNVI